MQIPGLEQCVRHNVGADYKQNSLHHNNITCWKLEVSAYVALLSYPLAEINVVQKQVIDTPLTLWQDTVPCNYFEAIILR